MNTLTGEIRCNNCGTTISIHANGDAACSCEYLDYESRGEEEAENMFNISDNDALRLTRLQQIERQDG